MIQQKYLTYVIDERGIILCLSTKLPEDHGICGVWTWEQAKHCHWFEVAESQRIHEEKEAEYGPQFRAANPRVGAMADQFDADIRDRMNTVRDVIQASNSWEEYRDAMENHPDLPQPGVMFHFE